MLFYWFVSFIGLVVIEKFCNLCGCPPPFIIYTTKHIVLFCEFNSNVHPYRKMVLQDLFFTHFWKFTVPYFQSFCQCFSLNFSLNNKLLKSLGALQPSEADPPNLDGPYLFRGFWPDLRSSPQDLQRLPSSKPPKMH